MVFESVVTNLLNKFLSDYVQNFDSSQLELSIWGDNIGIIGVVRDLDVKESALDELNLPIKLISCHIGILIVQIPIDNLYGTIATIEGLHIVVIPSQNDSGTEAEAAKQAELQRIKEAKRKATEKDGGEENENLFIKMIPTQIITDISSLFEDVAKNIGTKVLKNLEVKIKDIHLRYEYNFSDLRNAFTLGFTLHNLSFETTYEKWEPAIIQENINVIEHKLVVLDNLSVYSDSKAELYHKMSVDDRQIAMEKSIATSTFKPSEMKCISVSGVPCLLLSSLFVLLLAGMQVFRSQLPSTMAITENVLGSFLLILGLKAIGNFEAYMFLKGFPTKFFPEVLTSFLIAAFSSGLVHSVCFATCFWYSLVALYYMNKISSKVYHDTLRQHSTLFQIKTEYNLYMYVFVLLCIYMLLLDIYLL